MTTLNTTVQEAQNLNMKKNLVNDWYSICVDEIKNLFEKTYRRLLIDKLVENYCHYDMTREQAVINLM